MDRWFLKSGLAGLFLTGATWVSAMDAETYEPTWESLSKHEPAPEWLKDAKLGIYFHWGVYSVPAFGNEWYPRWMYFPAHDIAKHHRETYGSPEEFPYHNFIPQFTAEKFDAAEWAELFRRSGARYAGPVAEHHDGFSMWASKVNPWNAQDMGPKRDVLGELFKELEKRDIKTIATFHHSKNLNRFSDTWKKERRIMNSSEDFVQFRKAFRASHYPYIPGSITATEDPKLRILYGNMPEDEWCEDIWFGKLKEVIDNYRPDIIWFDSWLDNIPERHRQRFAAYYLNAAETWGKEVAIVRKQNDMPIDFTINDHEKSREPAALPELWMTDDTISTGSWCYTQDLEIKPLYKVLHALIDTVSKNGIVLLNISPMADGTIPQNQRDVLLGLGAWLEANGEAIYDTRPWVVAAEGPTSEPEGGLKNHRIFLSLEYSAKDVRYTVSKDGKTVYAMLLGVPSRGEEIILKAFADMQPSKVELLGGDVVASTRSGEGLKIEMPVFDGKGYPVTVFRISM